MCAYHCHDPPPLVWAEVGSVMGICIYKLTCPRGGEQLPYKLNPLLPIITVIYRWRVTIVYGHHQKPYTWNCNLNKQNPSPSLTPYWGRWGMTMVHNDILKKWTPSRANPFLLLYLAHQRRLDTLLTDHVVWMFLIHFHLDIFNAGFSDVIAQSIDPVKQIWIISPAPFNPRIF